MKKLEVGDYVKNLTEEQWDELNKVENSEDPLQFEMNNLEYNKCISFAIVYDFECFLFAEKRYCKTELTFEEFLSRAKNTFQP